MRRTHLCVALLAGFLIAGATGVAQQTIFNVPSPDVLAKGKVYAEFDDSTYFAQRSTEFEPRVVIGLGDNIEAGLNLPYFTEPGNVGTTAVSPALKWRFLDSGASGWTAYGGVHLFFPVHQRTYTIGEYVYAELSKSLKSGTRISVGPYDFTRGVVSTDNRAGIQTSAEQTVTKRLKADADWFSGKSQVGYLTPGITYSLSQKITIYAGYEVGNSGAIADDNHAFLWELGWNFN